MLYALTSSVLEVTEAIAIFTVKKTLIGAYTLGCWAFSKDKGKIENISNDYVLVQTDVVNLSDMEKRDEFEKIINTQTEIINEMRKELSTLKDKLEKTS